MGRPLQLYSQEELDAQADAHFAARAAHLQWCKDRALAELEHGTAVSAYLSYVSDAGNKTWKSVRGEQPPLTDFSSVLGATLMQIAQHAIVQNNKEAMRRWIKGFN